jgi:predicted transposase/invertase (TIGR01784 family)
MKFIDVTNDIAFRKIFGNENKKVSLISFLNAVIKLPDNKRITDVKIENPYQLPNLTGGKSTVVDVKATDEGGNTFIIEMQVAEADSFAKRVLYYTSQSYTSQIERGDNYHKLKPAYFIGILNFLISNNPNYLSCHKVIDVETGEHIIRDVEFNFIELPKFEKSINNLETNIDQWTYFIKNAENLKVIPDNISDEGLKQAYLIADKHNWTKAELDDYLRVAIKERDDIGRLELAEKRAEKRAELRTMKAIAIKLKNKGVAYELIAETTGLTLEEIAIV